MRREWFAFAMVVFSALGSISVDYMSTYTVPSVIYPESSARLYVYLVAGSMERDVKITVPKQQFVKEGMEVRLDRMMPGEVYSLPVELEIGDVEPGVYGVRMVLEYDENGEEMEREWEIPVKISSPLGITVEPVGELETGKDQNICFKITSSERIYGVKVDINGPVNPRTSSLFIPELQGEKIACVEAEPRGFQAFLSVSFQDMFGEPHFETFYLVFPVNRSADFVNVSVPPVTLEPGHEGTLWVSVSSSRELAGVCVKVGGKFEVLGSNTQCVDSMKSGRFEFSVYVDREAEEGILPVTVEVSWEGGKKVVTGGIEVRGNVDLEVYPKTERVKGDGTVIIANRGSVKARGTSVKVYQGDRLVVAEFLGDLEPRDYETVSVPDANGCYLVKVEYEGGEVSRNVCFTRPVPPPSFPWFLLLLIPLAWWVWRRISSSR